MEQLTASCGLKLPPHYLVDEEQQLFWDDTIVFWFNVDNVDEIPQSSPKGDLINIFNLLKFPIPSYKSWMKYFENKAIIDPKIIMICGNLYETIIDEESDKTLTFNTNAQKSTVNLQNSSEESPDIAWTDEAIYFPFEINKKSYQLVVFKDGKVSLMKPLR